MRRREEKVRKMSSRARRLVSVALAGVLAVGGVNAVALTQTALEPEQAYAAPAGTWRQSSGKWWYAYSGGSYATGWQQINGTWYYFDGSGWMKTGWQKVGGAWYYLKSSGAMATGWAKVGGTW